MCSYLFTCLSASHTLQGFLVFLVVFPQVPQLSHNLVHDHRGGIGVDQPEREHPIRLDKLLHELFEQGLVIRVFVVEVGAFGQFEQRADVCLSTVGSEHLHEPEEGVDDGGDGDIDEVEPEEDEDLFIEQVQCEKTLESVRLVVSQLALVQFANGHQRERLSLNEATLQKPSRKL